MPTEKEALECELLVHRCQRGDRYSQEKLIRDWERRLFYYVRRLLKDEQDAWDVLQEIWIKVLRNIPKLREPRALPSWLYRIARNSAISHLRRRQRRELRLGEGADPPDPHADRVAIRFDDAQRVHWALERLSPRHREALTLFFLEDLSLKEIADLIGCNVGTIKSRIHYAKRHMRAVLDEEEEACHG